MKFRRVFFAQEANRRALVGFAEWGGRNDEIGEHTMMRMVAVLLCVGCLLISGCSDSSGLGTVTGQVTMDGQPLANVMVTFLPTGGGNASTGMTDASGQYQLVHPSGRGAELGTHTVRVTTVQSGSGSLADVPSDSEEYMKMQMGGQDYEQASQSIEEKIPARYNTQSELTHEVTAGTNVIDLTLTSS
jgi:hypothetical protein